MRRLWLLLLIPFLAACAPVKNCPATCPEGMHCTDPQMGCIPIPPLPTCECAIPDAEAAGWEVVQVEVAFNALPIAWARDGVGDGCGTDPNVTLAKMAEKLREMNYCALGPWSDALAVTRPDGKVEEWHVVEFTDEPALGGKRLGYGCWYPLSKAFKNAWINTAGAAKAKNCGPKRSNP